MEAFYRTFRRPERALLVRLSMNRKNVGRVPGQSLGQSPMMARRMSEK